MGGWLGDLLLLFLNKPFANGMNRPFRGLYVFPSYAKSKKRCHFRACSTHYLSTLEPWGLCSLTNLVPWRISRIKRSLPTNNLLDESRSLSPGLTTWIKLGKVYQWLGRPQRIGLLVPMPPVQSGRYLWLQNGGDPKYLLGWSSKLLR